MLIRLVVAVVLIAATLASGGCRFQAQHAVRTYVDTEYKRLQNARSRISDPEIDAYLAEMAEIVLLAAREVDGNPEDEWDKIFTHDKFDVILVHQYAPNAWTHGDDFAVITSAEVLLAEHPDEILFLLAHEFGHMRDGHMVKQLTEDFASRGNATATGIIGALVVLAIGADEAQAKKDPDHVLATSKLADDDPMKGKSSQEILEMAAKSVEKVMAAFKPHKPKNEHDADAYAVDVVATAGYPLERSTDFHARLQSLYRKAGLDESTFESHPPTAERIAEITAKRRSLNHVPTRSLDVAKFRRFQARVEQLVGRDGDRIATYDDESIARSAAGESVPRAHACGPFHIAQDVFKENFVNRR